MNNGRRGADAQQAEKWMVGGFVNRPRQAIQPIATLCFQPAMILPTPTHKTDRSLVERHPISTRADEGSNPSGQAMTSDSGAQ